MSKPKSKKTVQIASEKKKKKKSPFSLGVDAKVFIGLILLFYYMPIRLDMVLFLMIRCPLV